MAKRAAEKREVREGPRETGLVWPCSSNVVAQAHGSLPPVVNRIRLDKNGNCYRRCPSCGDQQFFSRDWWTVNHGMTPQDAAGQGFVIL